MTSGISCPVCGAEDTQDCGAPAYRIPPRVAGVAIELTDLALRHRRCPACDYRFIWPRIPQDRLIDCYQRSANHWGTGADVAGERSYAHKRDLLERFAPARIAMDFGCYDGGFLDYLGPDWQKSGIEPSDHAAKVAESRGVRIIAPTLDAPAIEQHAGHFAAIIIFDVMEHLPDPVGDLTKLRRILMPGGIMLIETGNTDSQDWQSWGVRHPYAGIVEHLGFFNQKSIETAGRRAGLALAHFEKSVHSDPGREAGRTWRHVWAYQAIRTAHSAHLPLPRRLRDIAAGPVPRALHFDDHFLAVLRRES